MGSGSTVLLEAGSGADSTYWGSLPTVLARETGATVVAYDQAGYGQRDLPDTPYDVREEMAGLWRGLERLGLASSLIAVGHSYGGLLIQVLASDHPAEVHGLVYGDPMIVAYIDALGGPEGIINHPMMQHPFDRSLVVSLTMSQRAALRVEVSLPGTVETVRAKLVPRDVPT